MIGCLTETTTCVVAKPLVSYYLAIYVSISFSGLKNLQFAGVDLEEIEFTAGFEILSLFFPFVAAVQTM